MALNKKKTTTTVQQSRPAAVTTTPAKAKPNKTVQQAVQTAKATVNNMASNYTPAKAQPNKTVQQSLTKPTTPAKAQVPTSVQQLKTETITYPVQSSTTLGKAQPDKNIQQSLTNTNTSLGKAQNPYTDTRPYSSPNYSSTPTTPASSILNNQIGVTPTTSTGTDAFPSLTEALGGAGLTAAGLAGANPNTLLNAVTNPNDNPEQKTRAFNSVLDNILATSDMLTGSNLGVNSDYFNEALRRRNANTASKGLTDYEDIDNPIGNHAPAPYSSPNYGNYNPVEAGMDTTRTDLAGLTGSMTSGAASAGYDNLLENYYNSLGEKTIGGGGSSGGNGGGSRSGGGSGSGGGVGGLGGYDLDSLYDLINQQLAEYDNGYNTLMQNLLNAYNANYGSLNDSYLAALNALGLNYDDTAALLADRLASSQSALEDQRRRAMQEAYIARMMDQKNIEDYLGASGFSGGATESILSSLLNNYRSNRNKIEENTQNSLRDLLQNYLDNLSTARQNYNSGLLSAENNRLSAAQNLANNLYESQANAASNYANQRANVYNGLYDTLAKLALKG
jgi:hypothetical protein